MGLQNKKKNSFKNCYKYKSSFCSPEKLKNRKAASNSEVFN
jgi:hypothetical protein